MKQILATVVSKGEPIDGLYRPNGRSILFSQTIRLNCPEIARKAKPGQFVLVYCGEECLLPRPFSIHQVKNMEDLALYFAVLEGGKGTTWLSQRKEGDEIVLSEPLGNGFSVKLDSHNLLLVAGGMGIAPLAFLAQEALNKGSEVTLIYGTAVKHRYPEVLLPFGVKLVATTDDGSVGYRGLVTDLIPEYADWADQVFACGPLPMYKAMARMPELRNKAVQISLEVRMACGRGLCYGCSIKTRGGMKKVCQDGPVFGLGDIVWDEIVPV